jgi:hypothetical protein
MFFLLFFILQVSLREPMAMMYGSGRHWSNLVTNDLGLILSIYGVEALLSNGRSNVMSEQGGVDDCV